MKFTLGKLLSGRAASSIGACPTDTRLIEWANTAQESLMHRGRWYGTVARIRMCVSDGCIVWPREVATIERVNLCNTPIPNQGLWYDFTEWINPWCVDCCLETEPRLVELSNTPTIAEIEEGKQVVAIATNADDVGKEIVIQGYDENNAWVRTDDGGTPIDGEKLTLAVSPGTVSSTVWKAGGITAIQKDSTDYDVLLYQYDGANEQLLGRYQPGEEFPDYRRSSLKNIDSGCCCDDSDDAVYTVEAIVSLQHVPVSASGDFFVLQNQRAIELAMKSFLLEEDDKDAEAEIKFKKAIRELQHHNEKYWPGYKARVMASGHGTAHPAKLFSGFI